jgi:hypothetical protein
MAAKGTRVRNDARNNGKAPKKHPKTFDAIKRRVVSAK